MGNCGLQGPPGVGPGDSAVGEGARTIGTLRTGRSEDGLHEALKAGHALPQAGDVAVYPGNVALHPGDLAAQRHMRGEDGEDDGNRRNQDLERRRHQCHSNRQPADPA